MKILLLLLWCLVLILPGGLAWSAPNKPHVQSRATLDKEVAGRFAPIFHQALGDKRRSDYITNFDFDGDWRGDNNWENVDQKFPLRAYVYYSVSETKTHFFIHYAVFHPRDYKGGERKGRILSELIREGTKRSGEHDPTGLMAEAGVAHENDLEGVLVVVKKDANSLEGARVSFVQTFRHNDFAAYALEPARNGVGIFKTENEHVLLYVEPKGHGIDAYSGDEKQTSGKNFVIYSYTGEPQDPEKQRAQTVGYDLLPIESTLWQKARSSVKEKSGKTYGSSHNYPEISINVMQSNGQPRPRKIVLGKVGATFLGDTGGINMAKPPWAWFDKNRRNDPLGLWFFDPATTVKRDFSGDDSFSTVYVRLPFWAVQ